MRCCTVFRYLLPKFLNDMHLSKFSYKKLWYMASHIGLLNKGKQIINLAENAMGQIITY